MNVYLVTNLLVLLISFTFYILNIKSRTLRDNYIDFSNNWLYVTLVSILLIFISGFRGGFSTDYGNYIWIFNVISGTSFINIFSANKTLNIEIGYAFLNKLVSMISQNSVFFMTVISTIIVYCYMYQFKKNSYKVWLSVFLLVTVGSFYTSFNIMRQFLAGALFLCAANYIYKKSFIKYFFSILGISLFHKSVLVMLPFYFFLQIKWNKLKNILLLNIIILLFCITFIYSDSFVNFFIQLFYEGYAQEGAYGIEDGLSFIYVIRPFLFFIFNLIFIKCIRFSDNKETVWFNASFYFLLFTILSTRVVILQRLVFYFSPFMTLLVPRVIKNISDYKLKKIILFIVTIGALIYSFLTQRSEIYYFIWQ